MNDDTEYSSTGNYSNGYRLLPDFTVPNTDMEISYDLKVTANNGMLNIADMNDFTTRFGTGRQGAGNIVYSLNGFGDEGLWKVTSSYGSNYRTFKIIYRKSTYTYEFYLDYTLIQSKTLTIQSNKDKLDNISEWGVYFRTWANISIYVKNLKIKAL